MYSRSRWLLVVGRWLLMVGRGSWVVGRRVGRRRGCGHGRGRGRGRVFMSSIILHPNYPKSHYPALPSDPPFFQF